MKSYIWYTLNHLALAGLLIYIDLANDKKIMGIYDTKLGDLEGWLGAQWWSSEFHLQCVPSGLFSMENHL